MKRVAMRLWYYRLTPLLAFGAVCLLMIFSLVHQLQQWRALLTEQPQTVATSPAPSRGAVDLVQLSGLFGTAAAPNAPPRSTSLPLTLMGSFVSAQGDRSTALIKVSGKPSQRVLVGQEVMPGIRLESVHPQHAVILREGVTELLLFPRAKEARLSLRGGDQAAYPAFSTAQLGKLPAVQMAKQARRRFELLLQGMNSEQ
ncbi:hypothetical protein D3880_04990 [Pseudomonas cavernae]|uniref:Type II secretion system protein GspC N-terminal domain-containing protein n=1 Tax=Pseudomonas cavernae TaxID=2320867 RepID=A0A385Z1R6_9PSED|nr:type II secretion system protein N [Pseudomonas cavernae]AYC31778.1 hypothetical protein D3880_04990 [Pseudomonas cavernae]